MSDYTEHLISMAGGDGEPDALDLDAIQARADAATEGPWRLANPRPDGRNMVERPGYDLYGGEVSEMIIVDTNPADANFIANARTDVPALLALVREQQARIERVEALHVEDEQGKCVECTYAPFSTSSVKYPCPTIAALTATEGA